MLLFLLSLAGSLLVSQKGRLFAREPVGSALEGSFSGDSRYKINSEGLTTNDRSSVIYSKAWFSRDIRVAIDDVRFDITHTNPSPLVLMGFQNILDVKISNCFTTSSVECNQIKILNYILNEKHNKKKGLLNVDHMVTKGVYNYIEGVGGLLIKVMTQNTNITFRDCNFFEYKGCMLIKTDQTTNQRSKCNTLIANCIFQPFIDSSLQQYSKKEIKMEIDNYFLMITSPGNTSISGCNFFGNKSTSGSVFIESKLDISDFISYFSVFNSSFKDFVCMKKSFHFIHVISKNVFIKVKDCLCQNIRGRIIFEIDNPMKMCDNYIKNITFLNCQSWNEDFKTPYFMLYRLENGKIRPSIINNLIISSINLIRTKGTIDINLKSNIEKGWIDINKIKIENENRFMFLDHIHLKIDNIDLLNDKIDFLINGEIKQSDEFVEYIKSIKKLKYIESCPNPPNGIYKSLEGYTEYSLSDCTTSNTNYGNNIKLEGGQQGCSITIERCTFEENRHHDGQYVMMLIYNPGSFSVIDSSFISNGGTSVGSMFVDISPSDPPSVDRKVVLSGVTIRNVNNGGKEYSFYLNTNNMYIDFKDVVLDTITGTNFLGIYNNNDEIPNVIDGLTIKNSSPSGSNNCFVIGHNVNGNIYNDAVFSRLNFKNVHLESNRGMLYFRNYDHPSVINFDGFHCSGCSYTAQFDLYNSDLTFNNIEYDNNPQMFKIDCKTIDLEYGSIKQNTQGAFEVKSSTITYKHINTYMNAAAGYTNSILNLLPKNSAGLPPTITFENMTFDDKFWSRGNIYVSCETSTEVSMSSCDFLNTEGSSNTDMRYNLNIDGNGNLNLIDSSFIGQGSSQGFGAIVINTNNNANTNGIISFNHVVIKSFTPSGSNCYVSLNIPSKVLKIENSEIESNNGQIRIQLTNTDQPNVLNNVTFKSNTVSPSTTGGYMLAFSKFEGNTLTASTFSTISIFSLVLNQNNGGILFYSSDAAAKITLEESSIQGNAVNQNIAMLNINLPAASSEVQFVNNTFDEESALSSPVIEVSCGKFVMSESNIHYTVITEHSSFASITSTGSDSVIHDCRFEFMQTQDSTSCLAITSTNAFTISNSVFCVDSALASMQNTCVMSSNPDVITVTSCDFSGKTLEEFGNVKSDSTIKYNVPCEPIEIYLGCFTSISLTTSDEKKYEGKTLIITGCTFNQNTQSGIIIFQFTTTVADIVISDCTFSPGYDYGTANQIAIVIETKGNVTLKGDRFTITDLSKKFNHAICSIKCSGDATNTPTVLFNDFSVTNYGYGFNSDTFSNLIYVETTKSAISFDKVTFDSCEGRFTLSSDTKISFYDTKFTKCNNNNKDDYFMSLISSSLQIDSSSFTGCISSYSEGETKKIKPLLQIKLTGDEISRITNTVFTNSHDCYDVIVDESSSQGSTIEIVSCDFMIDKTELNTLYYLSRSALTISSDNEILIKSCNFEGAGNDKNTYGSIAITSDATGVIKNIVIDDIKVTNYCGDGNNRYFWINTVDKHLVIMNSVFEANKGQVFIGIKSAAENPHQLKNITLRNCDFDTNLDPNYLAVGFFTSKIDHAEFLKLDFENITLDGNNGGVLITSVKPSSLSSSISTINVKYLDVNDPIKDGAVGTHIIINTEVLNIESSDFVEEVSSNSILDITTSGKSSMTGSNIKYKQKADVSAISLHASADFSVTDCKFDTTPLEGGKNPFSITVDDPSLLSVKDSEFNFYRHQEITPGFKDLGGNIFLPYESSETSFIHIFSSEEEINSSPATSEETSIEQLASSTNEPDIANSSPATSEEYYESSTLNEEINTSPPTSEIQIESSTLNEEINTSPPTSEIQIESSTLNEEIQISPPTSEIQIESSTNEPEEVFSIPETSEETSIEQDINTSPPTSEKQFDSSTNEIDVANSSPATSIEHFESSVKETKEETSVEETKSQQLSSDRKEIIDTSQATSEEDHTTIDIITGTKLIQIPSSEENIESTLASETDLNEIGKQESSLTTETVENLDSSLKEGEKTTILSESLRNSDQEPSSLINEPVVTSEKVTKPLDSSIGYTTAHLTSENDIKTTEMKNQEYSSVNKPTQTIETSLTLIDTQYSSIFNEQTQSQSIKIPKETQTVEKTEIPSENTIYNSEFIIVDDMSSEELFNMSEKEDHAVSITHEPTNNALDEENNKNKLPGIIAGAVIGGIVLIVIIIVIIILILRMNKKHDDAEEEAELDTEYIPTYETQSTVSFIPTDSLLIQEGDDLDRSQGYDYDEENQFFL